MIRLLNVAIPAVVLAVTVALPFANVPPVKVSVTLVLVVTRFPYWSRAATLTAG